MKPELFSQLLERSESDTLDFKLTSYDLGQPGDDKRERERKRAKFAKDILAFGNCWRDESRYIVIGAGRTENGKIIAPGIKIHADSADLVQALEGLIHPCPRFHYAQVEFNGLQYGVITFPSERSIGPFFACKDIGGGDSLGTPLLRKHALYCRRDSSNEEANPSEQAAIFKWFQQGQTQPPLQFPQEHVWEQIVDKAQLDSRNCAHILILALDKSTQNTSLGNLTAVNWNMVIDLDPASQNSGALKQFRKQLGGRSALHVVSPEGSLLGDISKATTWYFANRLQTTSDPLPELKFKDWVTRYGKATTAKIEQLAASCIGPVSVVAVCEHTGRAALVRKLIEDIATNFGDRSTSIAIAEASGDWNFLELQGMTMLFSMKTQDFLDGLEAQARVAQIGQENVIQFPGNGGTPKDISPDNYSYLSEDLELVHRNAGMRPPEVGEPMKEFLRGAQITWFDLGFQSDVEREKTEQLFRLVDQDLENRMGTRINLYHEPGAGGSTIARRVLWVLHQRYPAVVLKRCSPKETCERIAFIYQLTGQATLILREGSDVPEKDADQLATLLASKHVPFVLLQTLRRYQAPILGNRSVFLRAQLTNSETERFRFAFEREAPNKKSQIHALAAGADALKTPFLFGLTAFANEFAGLRSFVKNHLAIIPQSQITILKYLSLAYDYGQQALAPSHFSELLQLPASRPVDFKKVLSEETRGLLIEQPDGRWRPMHQLVSTEILQLTLSNGAADTRLWKTGLGDLAQDFVKFCRTNSPVPPDDLRMVIEQVCVRRNDDELLTGVLSGENRFSKLVSDLPTSDARLKLFNQLVDIYPENPHFWAHLGRYYSIERQDFGKAEEAINKAIALAPNDPVLHHMKGMALRNLAFQLISEKAPLMSILTTAKTAAASFLEARQLKPDDDYGYIAEAQTILRVLDYARGDKDAVTVLSNETADPWLREGFERVETLLASVREQRKGELTSEHEDRCRAELDVLYGAHDEALQKWDQLLQKRNSNGKFLVYAPPIRRQIVWLQLARCNRNWELVSPKHLKRSLELLEENIQQEPDEDRNIRLWLQGARFLQPPPTLTSAADRVATWRMRGDSLDSIYYLYVFKILEALDGSSIAAAEAQRNIEICRSKASLRRDRTLSFEWLGNGEGLRRLVHQDQLGAWDETHGFWGNTKPLRRMEGVVSKIHAPQSGEIEIRWGLKAFFTPAVAKMMIGRDENRPVSFYLGFSYEGLRAWAVEPMP